MAPPFRWFTRYDLQLNHQLRFFDRFDRDRIVDVATTRAPLGKAHLHLVLESEGGRGLSASGAFALFAPAREPVPPVFYEIGPGDVETLRGLLLGRTLSEG